MKKSTLEKSKIFFSIFFLPKKEKIICIYKTELKLIAQREFFIYIHIDGSIPISLLIHDKLLQIYKVPYGSGNQIFVFSLHSESLIID